MRRRVPRIMVIVLITAALLASLILTTLPGTTRTRVGDFFGSLFDPVVTTVQKGFSAIGGFFTTYKDNSRLRAELQELQNRNAELRLEIEKNKSKVQLYEELKEALHLVTLFDGLKIQGAPVLNDGMGPFFDFIRVRAGRAQGVSVSVQTSYPVITADHALIGRVHSSELTSSKILPLISEAFSVSACVEGSARSPFRVRGAAQYRPQGLCVGDQIPEGTPVHEGDRIVTSGEGGLFPAGILIGEVVSVHADYGSKEVTCVIRPAADFGDLTYVFILTESEGTESSENVHVS